MVIKIKGKEMIVMSANPYNMRRSFVYKNDKLIFCNKRNVSCAQWLMGEEGMSEEEFIKTVHGAYYPGRAYFYKGLDNTTTDEEVEQVAESCRHLFNSQTEICCGAIHGKVGLLWEPIKIIGYGTGSSAQM